jgi:FkbM family methyltransferase
MPASYCGDHTSLAITKYGNLIYVDTRDTSLAPHLMMSGDWEPWVTNVMGKTLLKYEGCTFIDVGANVGWYTLLACKLGASHVFAFEPNPRMCELLRKTIAVNGYRERVTLTEAACGAEEGLMRLEVDPTEAGGGHVVPHRPRLQNKVFGECSVVRLDNVVFGGNVPTVDPRIIMKIDVEGFEPEVLRGGREILKLNPIIFLEHNQQAAHCAMYHDLLDAGFELRHAHHKGHAGEPLIVNQVMALGNAETVICAIKGAL